MNKTTDIAAAIAAKHGLKASEAKAFINEFINVLNEGLSIEKQVKVRGLGTFKVTSVSARESVDVSTGERIVIDGRDKISFTPDTVMRDLVNKPFAQFETVPLSDEVDFTEIDEKYKVSEEPETTPEEPKATLEEVETTPQEPEAPVVSETPEVSEEPEPTPEEQEAPVFSEIPEVSEEPETATKESESIQEKPEATPEEPESPMSSAISSTLLEETQAHNEQLLEQIEELKKVNKWLRTAVAALLLVLVACVFYTKSVVSDQKINDKEQTALQKDDADKVQNGNNTVSSEGAQLKDDNQEIDIYELDEPQAGTKTEPDKTTEKPATTTKPAEPTKQEPAKTADKPAQKPTEGKYDFDPRVKYGAYEIVGVLTEVKVEKGQTVYSISRKHLGPGLECYVEAMNGGTNQIKEGQTLKIPKLELKSKRKKESQ